MTTEAKDQLFAEDSFYYEEISNLTGSGGWSVDFLNKKSHFDKQARKILNVPDDFEPSLRNGHMFYAEEHLEKATALFFSCAQGESFSTDIKMITYDKRIFWARAQGKPLKNRDGQIIGIRGVFRDIDEDIKREMKLRNSLEIIESQNKRLFNFAHIVSHNLRSHVSNMQLTSAIFDVSNFTEEQTELFNNFKQIADNLDETIHHLNEVVSVQTKGDKGREKISIAQVCERVLSTLKQEIKHHNITITTNFKHLDTIDYVAAYMESILHNLITNAIKYRRKDVQTVIDIRTAQSADGDDLLIVKDNGLGIDLEKFGNKLFKMYKTFHHNEDATGIGLFITKNQIEAMGGRIDVESKPNVGTSFKIRL